MDSHVNYLLSQCAQGMYILKLLRHQGMSSQQIITVAYALILSRITCALPAWGGFLSAALIGKINAFFKRLKRTPGSPTKSADFVWSGPVGPL